MIEHFNCIYCDQDVLSGEDHDPDCPQQTGVYPVFDGEFTGGLQCADCKTVLESGELYTLREIERDDDIETGIVVCLGCGAIAACIG